jgi:ferredoxin
MCTQPGLNRLDAAAEPACVKTCPTDALQFGDRTAMIDEAKKKVSKLQSAGFSNATLYGETELGGLHVLYVLNDTPDKYGLPVNPQFPSTATAWKDVIQPVGMAAGGLVLVGLALNFVIARRSKMIEEKAAKKERKYGRR